MLSDVYDVVATVKSIRGTCPFGHKVGDSVRFNGKSVQGDMCYSALMTVIPRIHAMRYGIVYPWMTEKNVISLGCPDWENCVVFELKRTKQ
jgi:uncharacterized repeat protein (TIGR04076 family)